MNQLSDTIEVSIENLSTKGEGIARREGKVIFVPFTLENESWEIEIYQDKKNFSRAWPITLKTYPHPERVEPACPYFARCGGCHLQHMNEEKQKKSKRQWLQETFRRIGHLDVEVEPLIYSRSWEYRNKVRLLLLNHEGQIQLAYHHYGKPEEKVSVEDCPISHEVIRETIPKLLELMHLNWPTRWRNINADAKVTIQVEMETRAIVSFENVSPPEQVFNALENEGIKAGIVNKDTKKTESTDHDPMAFRQVNDRVKERLYDYVKELPYESKESLLEGYCGPGVLTSLLGDLFSNVIAVEANHSNVGLAKQEVRSQRHIKIHGMKMETFLHKNKDSYNVVLLNPPRSGLSKNVREKITKVGARDFVMISCHPAALARDTAYIVDAGYEVKTIQPFDMFPQTYHLESVIHLQKA